MLCMAGNALSAGRPADRRRGLEEADSTPPRSLLQVGKYPFHLFEGGAEVVGDRTPEAEGASF